MIIKEMNFLSPNKTDLIYYDDIFILKLESVVCAEYYPANDLKVMELEYTEKFIEPPNDDGELKMMFVNDYGNMVTIPRDFAFIFHYEGEDETIKANQLFEKLNFDSAIETFIEESITKKTNIKMNYKEPDECNTKTRINMDLDHNLDIRT